METFAYLQTACVYEDPEAVTLTLPMNPSNIKQLSSQATLLMLQLLIPAAILAVAGHASALQVGDRGPSVTTLQDRLRSTGYFNRRSTGVYASITADAVRRFQASRGLVVDGIAGPATQRALRGQSYAASGNVRPISSTTYYGDTIYRPIANTGGLQCSGSSGISVRDLQQRLNDRGYAVGIDGIFGSETCRALRQFQADNGLVVDGIPGPATRTALGLSPNPSDSVNPSVSIRKQYVVVVPVKSTATLSQVQQVARGRVFIASSNLGKYVQAGAFDIRGLAEAEATRLRAYKFDAQVRYF